MKIIVNFSRVIVGVLFIFSGLVKANDPAGLSYKMQEFFEVWGNNASLKNIMQWMNDYSLAFSMIIITFEIIVGIALLLGWMARFFSWLLFLLIIFFTFLTAYAVFSGKIRSCGCFGDCLPLTAMQSLMKDIILLILSFVILIGAKYIKPIFKGPINFFVIFLATCLVVSFQLYVLRHLPVKDCLPFKIGNNIIELRKMPADAVMDKMDFIFIYSKDGKEKEFNKTELPDSSWTFVKRRDIILEKGKNNEPPIKDFVLNTLSGSDTTEAILAQAGEYYLFFLKELGNEKREWTRTFTDLNNFAKQKNRPLIIVASQATAANDYFNVKNNFNLPVVSCDVTAVKTAARSNPTLFLMKGAVVQNKWGWVDLDKAAK